MKTLFVSSLGCVLLGFLWSSPAAGARASEGLACLEAGDLSCAIEVRDTIQNASSEAGLRLAMRIAFREGRYADAVEILDALERMGVDVVGSDSNPYRPTAAAAMGFEEEKRSGVVLRHAGGVERVLVEDGLDVLTASRTTYDSLFGGGPDHEVLLDIFPTARRFIAASGLPPEAVRTTGVVALSKWSRLLISSPRARARGYGWKDTVAHEYIHLVVAWRSGDRTPVWLQEGLAKHLEGRWRGELNAPLSVHQQALLSRALEEDAFVPFEKFRHSMAYLDSGDEAALAFAQVSTLVGHVLDRGGQAVLTRVMDRIRNGEEPEQVMAEAGGYASFADLQAGWRTWLRTRALSDERVAALPVVLDGAGDEYAGDPLLAQRGDLVRLVRVGDLLRERNRPLAALIEYRKAMDPEAPRSPLLMAREAQCLLSLEQYSEARQVLESAVELYPEFTLLQVLMGTVLDALGQYQSAEKAWRVAHDLNPFDPDVQEALAKDLEALGDLAGAAKHARYARILRSGGVED